MSLPRVWIFCSLSFCVFSDGCITADDVPLIPAATLAILRLTLQEVAYSLAMHLRHASRAVQTVKAFPSTLFAGP